MKSLSKPVLWGIGGYLALLALLMAGFIADKVPIRQLGITYASLFLFGIFALTILIQRSHRDNDVGPTAADSSAKSNRKAARNYFLASLAMFVILIYGLANTHTSPLWVIIVGASINICITVMLLLLAKSKLRDLR